MKRILSCAIATAVLISTFVSVALFQTSAALTHNTFYAMKSENVVIDGVRSENEYKENDVILVDQIGHKLRVEDTDPNATGQAWASFDNEYIYVYVDVVDTTPSLVDGGQFQTDSIEIYVDFNNEKDEIKGANTLRNTEGAYCSQIRFQRKEGQDITGGCSADTAPGADYDTYTTTEFVVVSNDNGYQVEAKIPHYNLMLKKYALSTGAQIGFAVQINDCITPGTSTVDQNYAMFTNNHSNMYSVCYHSYLMDTLVLEGYDGDLRLTAEELAAEFIENNLKLEDGSYLIAVDESNAQVFLDLEDKYDALTDQIKEAMYDVIQDTYGAEKPLDELIQDAKDLLAAEEDAAHFIEENVTNTPLANLGVNEVTEDNCQIIWSTKTAWDTLSEYAKEKVNAHFAEQYDAKDFSWDAQLEAAQAMLPEENPDNGTTGGDTNTGDSNTGGTTGGDNNGTTGGNDTGNGNGTTGDANTNTGDSTTGGGNTTSGGTASGEKYVYTFYDANAAYPEGVEPMKPYDGPRNENPQTFGDESKPFTGTIVEEDPVESNTLWTEANGKFTGTADDVAQLKADRDAAIAEVVRPGHMLETWAIVLIAIGAGLLAGAAVLVVLTIRQKKGAAIAAEAPAEEPAPADETETV